MPGRSSSFSRPSVSSYKLPSSSSSKSSPVVAPSTASSTPVQHHNVKVEQPGFFSNMMQGFALGTGQSFAFNLFRSNPTPAPSIAPASASPDVSANSSIESSLPKEFVKCMKETNNDKEACNHYLD